MREILNKFKIYGVRQSLYFGFCEIRRMLWSELVQRSYGQAGEDKIIDSLLDAKPIGFYVDVGANHPHRFSNTKRFYDRGWTGINIEPNLVAFNRFVRARPRDINVNVGVGPIGRSLTFHEFFPDMLSTFSVPEVNRYVADGFQLIAKREIPVLPLREILDRYAEGRAIDFMSVDTEGFDLEALHSNDWERFRPRIVCVETGTPGLRDGVTYGTAINEFLTQVGYESVYRNNLNTLFRSL